MTPYDYAVIVIYLCFISSIGLIFRKFSKDSSDFFRGGGHVLWWMVGATAFMSQFSSWTFIGAASKAYTDGPLVLAIYFGNGLGYLIAAIWSARKFRQMRVVTPMEGVRDRFGRASEQFFTWVWIPIGITYAGIWLNAVSKFASIVFGLDLTKTIVVVGFVVLIVAFLGGAWAVVASDFMQMMILMCITLVVATLSIQAVGAHFGGGGLLHGLNAFVNHLPSQYFNWSETHTLSIVGLWIAAFVLKQVCLTNDMKDADRFLCSKDSKNARRAALLAAILFFIGPIIWFIPPMAAAILYPDLSVIPELRGLAKVNEGAYVAIGLKYMPLGMIGLMMSAVFAATMSNMDTGLNKNAGIFIRNFYKPILRKHAHEREYVFAGRIASFVFGMLIILVAYIITKLDVGIFRVMNDFSAMVALPFIMPLIWGIIIKRTPSWAGWSTVCVGFAGSLAFKHWLKPDVFGIGPQEAEDYSLIGGTLINVVVCSLWFLGTSLFARFNAPEYAKKEEEFFKRMHTPVVSDPNESRAMDVIQLKTLSRMCIPYGTFVLLLAIIPNDFEKRLCFVFAGGLIVLIGLLLRAGARRRLAHKPAQAARDGG